MSKLISWQWPAAVLLVGISLSVASTASAEDEDARTLLRKVDQATRRVETATFSATLEGTGARAKLDVEWTGDVSLQRLQRDEPIWGKVLLEGAQTLPGERESQAFVLCYDGKTMTTRSGNAPVSQHGPYVDRAAELADRYFDLWVTFIHPTPFSDEINASDADLEGRVAVADVLCDVVLVDYDGQHKARWYFGVEDHLPRKVERLQDLEGRAGASVTTLRDLRTNVQLPPGTFSLGSQPETTQPDPVDSAKYEAFVAELQKIYAESQAKSAKGKELFLLADGSGFRPEKADEARTLLRASSTTILRLKKKYPQYHAEERALFASVDHVLVQNLWVLSQIELSKGDREDAIRYWTHIISTADEACDAIRAWAEFDPSSGVSAQYLDFEKRMRAAQVGAHMFMGMEAAQARDAAQVRHHFGRAVELESDPAQKASLTAIRDNALKGL